MRKYFLCCGYRWLISRFIWLQIYLQHLIYYDGTQFHHWCGSKQSSPTATHDKSSSILWQPILLRIIIAAKYISYQMTWIHFEVDQPLIKRLHKKTCIPGWDENGCWSNLNHDMTRVKNWPYSTRFLISIHYISDKNN